MPPSLSQLVRIVVIGLAVVLGSGAGTGLAQQPRLEYRTVKGQEYVTMRSIQKFYNFPRMKREGSKIILENDKYRLIFSVGGQVVLMNGVKFIFSAKVLPHEGRYLVHTVDFAKLVDPVMRPRHAKTATPFNTVIIDPGHGGRDSGAASPYRSEAFYALSLGMELKNILESKGYKVVMTRKINRTVSLAQRVAIANRYRNAIFISLHFNSGGGGSATGIETFTLSPRGVAHYGRNAKSSDAQTRRGNHQDAANIVLATAIHQSTIDATKSFDRGIKRARWSVLTGLKHPGILFEGGFLNNRNDARKINNPKYRRAMATSIYRGIQLYRMAVTKR